MRFEMMYEDHPKAKGFLDRYFPGSEIIRVRRDGSMQVGQCYNNVRQIIARQGGSSVLGFVPLIIRGILIEAVHHAIWKNPAGEMIDVTGMPQPGMQSSRHSAFILLPETTPGPGDPTVAPVFHPFRDAPVIRAYMESNIARMASMAKIKEILEKHHIHPREDGTVAVGVGTPEDVYRALSLHEQVDITHEKAREAFLSWIARI